MSSGTACSADQEVDWGGIIEDGSIPTECDTHARGEAHHDANHQEKPTWEKPPQDQAVSRSTPRDVIEITDEEQDADILLRNDWRNGPDPESLAKEESARRRKEMDRAAGIQRPPRDRTTPRKHKNGTKW